MINRLQFITPEGVVLLHDNAQHPHVSRVTYSEQTKFKWEQLDPPSYSPHMSPSDFHVIGSLNKYLKGKRLNLGDETQGHCEELCLVTAPGVLGTRKPSVR
ncbi:hypothetical protein TNCV_4925421 [Trichonephila clavipes]|nr:hypothetical protein TNCV_4925421 [Trichonephila clavipes]